MATTARTYNVVQVENVDQACEVLRSPEGLSSFASPRTTPGGIRTAFFRDRDGHVWEISSDLPDETDA
jgi:uncharacterized glyoxalase superfamily protein PhnB